MDKGFDKDTQEWMNALREIQDKTFRKLSEIDVSEHIDEKDTGKTKLKYLSWAWAWDYFKKTCPDAKYEIKHWDGKPYMYDELAGYMVETSITAGEETHTMWLPVMDGTNRALLGKPYTIRVKKYNNGRTEWEDKEIPAATMFDINKTIMRCLVKNMAMFGLGLYIYAGEDLPADNKEDEKPVPVKDKTKKPTKAEEIDEIPFSMPIVEPSNPDTWLTVNAFAGEMLRCNDITEISKILTSQKGNPKLQELIPLATARKQEILNTLPQA